MSALGDEQLVYVREVAPADVVATLDWLLASSFVIGSARGGPNEGFGNVQVILEREGLGVDLVGERRQWFLSFVLRDSTRVTLSEVLLSMGGTKALSWIEQPDLPVQLPAGVSWREAVPRALAWMADPRPQVSGTHPNNDDGA